MRNAVLSIVAGFLAVCAGVLVEPAGAVPLLAGNSVTVDGLMITIVDCTLANAAHGPQGCLATDNLELVAGAGPVPSVTIQATTGDIFDATAHDTNTYDLSVDLTVATVGGGAPINSAALSMTGSAAPGDESWATAGENVANASSTSLGPEMNVDLSSPTASMSFATQNLIRISKDIKDFANFASGPVILTSVTQTFGQAPEPGTIVLLLTGLTALGAVRRRS